MLAGFLISPLVSMVYHSFEGDFKEILRNEKENFKFIIVLNCSSFVRWYFKIRNCYYFFKLLFWISRGHGKIFRLWSGKIDSYVSSPVKFLTVNNNLDF
jgi:hypothetical protein